MKPFRLLLASLCFLGACQTTTSTSDVSESTPVGSWSLVAFDLVSGQSVPVPDGSRYTLTLQSDPQASVRADCNLCSGSYSLSGNSLDFGLMACTRAACPADSLEMPYLEALGSTSSYARTSEELLLQYEGGVMRFLPR